MTDILWSILIIAVYYLLFIRLKRIGWNNNKGKAVDKRTEVDITESFYTEQK